MYTLLFNSCFSWSYNLLIYLARDQSLCFSNTLVWNILGFKHRWEETIPYKGGLGNWGDKSETVLPITLLTAWQSTYGMTFYSISEKENNEIMNFSSFDWLRGADDLFSGEGDRNSNVGGVRLCALLKAETNYSIFCCRINQEAMKAGKWGGDLTSDLEKWSLHHFSEWNGKRSVMVKEGSYISVWQQHSPLLGNGTPNNNKKTQNWQ